MQDNVVSLFYNSSIRQIRKSIADSEGKTHFYKHFFDVLFRRVTEGFGGIALFADLYSWNTYLQDFLSDGMVVKNVVFSDRRPGFKSNPLIKCKLYKP